MTLLLELKRSSGSAKKMQLTAESRDGGGARPLIG